MDTAIIGASGYAGEEAVRLLARHPRLRLAALTSRQFAGQRAGDVVGGLTRSRDLLFEDLSPEAVAGRAEIFFLALPHGVSASYAVPLRRAGKTVVDLSADFRLRDAAVYKEFYGQDHPAPELLGQAVYALPELHAEACAKADFFAAPGCYPTALLLALAPAVQAGLLDLDTLAASAISGVTGAGKKVELPYLFGEIDENLRPYGVTGHRHLSEIEQELGLLAGRSVALTFTPHLAPLRRGIAATVSARLAKPLSQAGAQSLYEAFYAGKPFVRVLPGGALPEVRRVAGTNFAEVAVRVDARTGRLLLFSAIDNLVKGTAGQGIQALNLRLGFPEEEGLL
ncbi:MAG: N-acetyl-gamma-glutamyl-phosphate reductase [Verrucomicrobium sp.]|nr:N-acetyl-gamma-glutamyl-phosphate reductase [Verrucomicrobium sp.]